jgi:hypothetical protein
MYISHGRFDVACRLAILTLCADMSYRSLCIVAGINTLGNFIGLFLKIRVYLLPRKNQMDHD